MHLFGKYLQQKYPFYLLFLKVSRYISFFFQFHFISSLLGIIPSIFQANVPINTGRLTPFQPFLSDNWMEPWVQFSELRFASSIVISWAPHLHLEVKWRASKTSSSSTSWKISFPFPEKRKTYLVVGLFHLQVPRKKILRNKMIHLSLERGLSNCLPNCNFLILSKSCSIELENIFQIVIYIYISWYICITIGLRLVDTLRK